MAVPSQRQSALRQRFGLSPHLCHWMASPGRRGNKEAQSVKSQEPADDETVCCCCCRRRCCCCCACVKGMLVNGEKQRKTRRVRWWRKRKVRRFKEGQTGENGETPDLRENAIYLVLTNGAQRRRRARSWLVFFGSSSVSFCFYALSDHPRSSFFYAVTI